MTKKSIPLPPGPAIEHGSWSGKFKYPDTTGLVNLPVSGFSLTPFSLNCFQEKRWCYAGVIHKDIIFGCAVVHLGYLTSAFCFGFDRKTRQMVEHTVVWPPLGQVCFDRNPETGTCRFKVPGKFLEISSGPGLGTKKIEANFRFSGQSIQADIDILPPSSGIDPMHFFMPMDEDAHALTTKIAGLRARGQIRLNGMAYDLEPDESHVLFDWTHGAYPRQTFWNWACGAGGSREGASLGFNFSSGVYENGILENIIWINGCPEPVDRVDFSYDAVNPDKPWKIKSRDNRINLLFTPEGIRKANDNFGIIKSRFIQPCGKFSGSIKSRTGDDFILDELGGVVEEHFAKW
ncbi:MAG: DUF2804 domain-containing protein [Desulfobacteraceae bacterium]|nr:DUF2804 domain-containing protein [Desulfobacteraceae bacterium]